MRESMDLLSVDVEALVRKRAAYTFRSPHHYPVELVRDAARRGAQTVTMRLTGSRIEITDDGEPHPPEALQALSILLDSTATVAVRVAAMEGFEARRGLGLLAALAPGPTRLRVERAGSDPGAMEYRPGRSPTLDEATFHRNCVLIERRGRPQKERRVLQDWCRWASLPIIVDDETIGGGEPTPHLGISQLASDQGIGEGRLWLPLGGEACRVWLLDHGIQWRLAAYEPDHGLIYEAAVESPEIPPRHLRNRLRSQALDLYVRAIEIRDTLPEHARDRLDELVFLHHRRTDSRHLMGSYAPFRVAGSDRHLSLDEIRDRAAHGAVMALPTSTPVQRYAVEDDEVLLLTPRQWEYLEEHAGIPLTPPPRRPRRRGVVWRALGEFGRRLRAAAGELRSAGRRPIPRDALGDGEAALVDGLTGALRAGRCYLPGLEGVRDVPVAVVPGGAWRPAALIHTTRPPQVVLHRANRDVRLAARAAARDKELLPLVLPLLFNGHDGWI